MKKFTVPCNFGGTVAPFTVYIGAPEDKHHPLHFQADWLSKERGGTIPQEIMDSMAKLKDLADKNGVAFEDLCVYALGSATDEANGATDAKLEEALENPEEYEDEK